MGVYRKTYRSVAVGIDPILPNRLTIVICRRGTNTRNHHRRRRLRWDRPRVRIRPGMESIVAPVSKVRARAVGVHRRQSEGSGTGSGGERGGVMVRVRVGGVIGCGGRGGLGLVEVRRRRVVEVEEVVAHRRRCRVGFRPSAAIHRRDFREREREGTECTSKGIQREREGTECYLGVSIGGHREREVGDGGGVPLVSR